MGGAGVGGVEGGEARGDSVLTQLIPKIYTKRSTLELCYIKKPRHNHPETGIYG